MTNNNNFFRTVFDAMVEGRERSAKHKIAHYRKALKLNNKDSI